MQCPKECPVCKGSFESFYPGEEEKLHACLLQRGELDWDSDEPHRIDDQVMECSHCHTLFRLRWQLESFHQLAEVQDTSVASEAKQ